MTIPDKITFRPGTLAGPMAKQLRTTKETPSEYIRRLIAADCGVSAPQMAAGNPNFGQRESRTK